MDSQYQAGYVYHMLTAVYVDSQVSEFNHIVVGGNGACVTETNGVNKYLFHNPNERTVTLIVLTQSENIASSWRSQISILEHLSSNLESVWKGAHYVTVFYCSHCLLIKQDLPTTKIDPEWMRKFGLAYTGKKTCVCTSQGGSSIPYPLLFPCKYHLLAKKSSYSPNAS